MLLPLGLADNEEGGGESYLLEEEVKLEAGVGSGIQASGSVRLQGSRHSIPSGQDHNGVCCREFEPKGVYKYEAQMTGTGFSFLR